IVAPAAGATIGAASVVAHGASATYWRPWLAWFASNALTALAMLPACLVLFGSGASWRGVRLPPAPLPQGPPPAPVLRACVRGRPAPGWAIQVLLVVALCAVADPRLGGLAIRSGRRQFRADRRGVRGCLGSRSRPGSVRGGGPGRERAGAPGVRGRQVPRHA